MDPVSLLFTAYLDSIQNTVHARFTDLHGTEIQAVMIDYQGVKVPYQYHRWRELEWLTSAIKKSPVGWSVIWRLRRYWEVAIRR